MTRVVVRQWGSGRCHVADVPDDAFREAVILRRPAKLVALGPVVCACRVQLREARAIVVVMTDASVNCRTCKRLTGVERVKDGALT